jgi:hypothetical protein
MTSLNTYNILYSFSLLCEVIRSLYTMKMNIKVMAIVIEMKKTYLESVIRLQGQYLTPLCCQYWVFLSQWWSSRIWMQERAVRPLGISEQVTVGPQETVGPPGTLGQATYPGHNGLVHQAISIQLSDDQNQWYTIAHIPIDTHHWTRLVGDKCESECMTLGCNEISQRWKFNRDCV